MIIPFVLSTIFVVAPDTSKNALSVDEIHLVRDAVYKEEAVLYSRDPPDDGIQRYLEVPKPLEVLFKKHPAAVLDVLQVIIEGARPSDSRLAAGYAFELLEGPGRGVIVITFFEKNVYDVLDKNWEATPPEHLIKLLARSRKKAAEAGQRKVEK